ncbi:carboxyl-terminal processing protease [Undibacterium sp. GrIS 1.2]
MLMKSRYLFALTIAVTSMLSACGDGGGGSATTAAVATTGTTTLVASSTVQNLCQSPRTGLDPLNGNTPYPDKQGTLANEKTWLRSWIDETYLWYKEVPTTLNPDNYSSAIAYFNDLKTNAITASGKPKDQFHFTYTSAEWDALSQQSVELGYGINWATSPSGTKPRKWVITYVESGSPSANAGLRRGDQLFSVDNVDFLNSSDSASVAALNAGLFPATAGETHQFVVTRAASNISVTLAASNVTTTPVQNVKTIATATGNVGYLTFNSHNAVSELQLINAINQLKSAGITDLVLDLRYNGGGYLNIASELAYMIAGPTATAGKTFEQTQFNDKYLPGTPTPFYSTTQGFSATSGQALPYLGLKKVSVLTTAGTCSASESVINSLQGIDIEVDVIGAQTCGKPYGFYPTPNCGTTYFAIQFKGVNNKGFGDYADGIPPTCSVADDFTHAIGDPAEGQLAAALSYRNNRVCPAASSGVQLPGQALSSPMLLVRPISKEIAIYTAGKK